MTNFPAFRHRRYKFKSKQKLIYIWEDIRWQVLVRERNTWRRIWRHWGICWSSTVNFSGCNRRAWEREVWIRWVGVLGCLGIKVWVMVNCFRWDLGFLPVTISDWIRSHWSSVFFSGSLPSTVGMTAKDKGIPLQESALSETLERLRYL